MVEGLPFLRVMCLTIGQGTLGKHRVYNAENIYEKSYVVLGVFYTIKLNIGTIVVVGLQMLVD